MKRALTAAALSVGLVVGLASATIADDRNRLRAVPFEYVGAAGDCGEFPVGTPYPAGSSIVTAKWLGGMGLPDNGGQNTSAAEVPDYSVVPNVAPIPNPNRSDRHRGLLLSKNGPSPDCSAAGAEIKGVKRLVVTAGFELGFDYRNGGHCGAGAPRFNVVSRPPSGPDVFHFVGGCANDSAATPAPQDTQWTQVRFDVTSASEAFPPIPVGNTIRSIDLIFDEGTDTANNDTQGVGLAVVDNIFITGLPLIAKGSKDDDDDDHHDRD